MTAYEDKLKDPRWQKRRLEIMKRDFFECQLCLDDSTTLTVHHLWYDIFLEPWEYPGEALITLCKPCHFLGITPDLKMVLPRLTEGAELNCQLLRDLNEYKKKAQDRITIIALLGHSVSSEEKERFGSFLELHEYLFQLLNRPNSERLMRMEDKYSDIVISEKTLLLLGL